MSREYTRVLIRDFANGSEVALVGSPHLAQFAEAELHGNPVPDELIRQEIAPCFRDGERRTDTVVLACTHYPLLLERLEQLAPWPVTFVDPAPAIARRVVDLSGSPIFAKPPVPARALFSSGRRPTGQVAAVLARFGIHG